MFLSLFPCSLIFLYFHFFSFSGKGRHIWVSFWDFKTTKKYAKIYIYCQTDTSLKMTRILVKVIFLFFLFQNKISQEKGANSTKDITLNGIRKDMALFNPIFIKKFDPFKLLYTVYKLLSTTGSIFFSSFSVFLYFISFY